MLLEGVRTKGRKWGEIRRKYWDKCYAANERTSVDLKDRVSAASCG